MKYLIIGLLISIGWHIGKLVMSIVWDIVDRRIHRSKLYSILIGKHDKKKKSNESGEVQMRIGFRY